ncbi:MAG: heme-binding domain-containing protein, partial [Algoriphagus sp.]|uniref:heme-binding domain-containing protein n=1 Tax=Algoriphagus sp. TaxID=1872435 RepID=UPI003297A652
ELNFSEFGSLSGRMKKMKLESMIKQIEQEKMPIPSYTLVHRDAILSDAERKELTTYLKTLH